MPDGDRDFGKPATEQADKDKLPQNGGDADRSTNNEHATASSEDRGAESASPWLDELLEDSPANKKPSEGIAAKKASTDREEPTAKVKVPIESRQSDSKAKPTAEPKKQDSEVKPVEVLPFSFRAALKELFVPLLTLAVPAPADGEKLNEGELVQLVGNKPLIRSAGPVPHDELMRMAREHQNGTLTDAEKPILMEAIYKNLKNQIGFLCNHANANDPVTDIEGTRDASGKLTEIEMVRFKDKGVSTNSKFLISVNADGTQRAGNKADIFVSRFLDASKFLGKADEIETSLKTIDGRRAEEAAKAKTAAEPVVAVKPGSDRGGAPKAGEAPKPAKPEPKDYAGLAKYLGDISTNTEDEVKVAVAKLWLDKSLSAGKDQLNSRTAFRDVLEKERDNIIIELNTPHPPSPDVGNEAKGIANFVFNGVLAEYDKPENANHIETLKRWAGNYRLDTKQLDNMGPRESYLGFAKSLDANKTEDKVRSFLQGKIPEAVRNGKETMDPAAFEALLKGEKDALKPELEKCDAAFKDRAVKALEDAVTDYKAGISQKDYASNLTNGALKDYSELARDLVILAEAPGMTPAQKAAETEKSVREFVGAKALKAASASGILEADDATSKAAYKDILTKQANSIKTALDDAKDAGGNKVFEKDDAAKNIKKAAIDAAIDAAKFNTAGKQKIEDHINELRGITPAPVVPQPGWGTTFAQYVLPSINSWWSAPKDLTWAYLIGNSVRTGVEVWRHPSWKQPAEARPPLHELIAGTAQKNFTLANWQRNWYARAANQRARLTPIDMNTGNPVSTTHPGLDPRNPDHYFRVEPVYRDELQERLERNQISGRASRMIDPARPNPRRPSVFDQLPRRIVEKPEEARRLIADQPVGAPGIAGEVAENPNFTGKTTNEEFLGFADQLLKDEIGTHIPDSRRVAALKLYIEDLSKRALTDPKGKAIWGLYTDRGNDPANLDPDVVRARIGGAGGIASALSTSQGFTGATKNTDYLAIIKRAYNEEMDSHTPDLIRAEALDLYYKDVQRLETSKSGERAIYGIHEAINGHPVDSAAAFRLIADDVRGGTRTNGIASNLALRPDFNGRTTNAQYKEMIKQALRVEEGRVPLNPQRLKALDLYLEHIENQGSPATTRAIYSVHEDMGHGSLDENAAKLRIRDAGTPGTSSLREGIASEVMRLNPDFNGGTKISRYLEMVKEAESTALTARPLDTERIKGFELYIKQLELREQNELAYHRAYQDTGRNGISDTAAKDFIRDIGTPGNPGYREGIASEIVRTNRNFTGATTEGQYLAMVEQAYRDAQGAHPPNVERLRALETYTQDLKAQGRTSNDPTRIAYHEVHFDRFQTHIQQDPARELIHDRAAGSGVIARDGIATEIVRGNRFNGTITNAAYLTMVDTAYSREQRNHPPNTLRLQAFEYHMQDIKDHIKAQGSDKLAYHFVHHERTGNWIEPNAARALVRDTVAAGGSRIDGIASDIYNSAHFNGTINNQAYLDMVNEAYEAEKLVSPPDALRLQAYEHYINNLQNIVNRGDAGESALEQNYLDRGFGRVDQVAANDMIEDSGTTRGIAGAIVDSPQFTGRTTIGEYLDMIRRAQTRELSGRPDPTRARAYELLIKRFGEGDKRKNRGELALFVANEDRGRPPVVDTDAEILIPSISRRIPVNGKTTDAQYLTEVRRNCDIELGGKPDPTLIKAYDRHIQKIVGENRVGDAPALVNVIGYRGGMKTGDGPARALIPDISNSIDIDGITPTSTYLRLVEREQEAELGGGVSGTTDPVRARAFEILIEDIKSRLPKEPFAARVAAADRGNPVTEENARALIADNGTIRGIVSEVSSSPDFTGKTTHSQYLTMVKAAQRIELSHRPINPERIAAFEYHVKDIEGITAKTADAGIKPALTTVARARGESVDKGDARKLIPDIAKDIDIDGSTNNRDYLKAVKEAESAALAKPISLARAEAFKYYVEDVQKLANIDQEARALPKYVEHRGLAEVKDADARALFATISREVEIDGNTRNDQYLKDLKTAQAEYARKAGSNADPTKVKAYDLLIEEANRRASVAPADRAYVEVMASDRGENRPTDVEARLLISGDGGIADSIAKSTRFTAKTPNTEYLKLVTRARDTELSNRPPDSKRLRAFELYINDIDTEVKAGDRTGSALRWVNNDIGNAAPTIAERNSARESIAKTELGNLMRAKPLASNSEYLNQLLGVQEHEKINAHPPDEARIEAVDELVAKWTDIVKGNASTGVKADPEGPAYTEHAKEASPNAVPSYDAIETAKADVLKPLRDAADKNPERYTNKNCLDDLRRARAEAIKANNLGKVMACNELIYGDSTGGQGWEAINRGPNSLKPAQETLYTVSGLEVPRVTNAEARALIRGENGIADTIFKSPKFKGDTSNATYLTMVKGAYDDEKDKTTDRDPKKIAAFELYLKEIEAEKRPADKPALRWVKTDIGEPAPSLEQVSSERTNIAKELNDMVTNDPLTSNKDYFDKLLKVQAREKTQTSLPSEAKIEAVDELAAKWKTIVDRDAKAGVKDSYAYLEHNKETGVIPDHTIVQEEKDGILSTLAKDSDRNPEGYTNKACFDDLCRERDAAIKAGDFNKAVAYDELISGDGASQGWREIIIKNAAQPARKELYTKLGKVAPDLSPSIDTVSTVREKVREIVTRDLKEKTHWDVAANKIESYKTGMKPPKGISTKAWELAVIAEAQEARNNHALIIEEQKRGGNRRDYEEVAREKSIFLPHESFTTAAHELQLSREQEAEARHVQLRDDIYAKYLREGRALGIPMHSVKEGWAAMAYQTGEDHYNLEMAHHDPKYLKALESVHNWCVEQRDNPATVDSPADTLANLFEPSGSKRNDIIDKVYNDLAPTAANPISPLDIAGDTSFNTVRKHIKDEIDVLPEGTEQERNIKAGVQKFYDSLTFKIGEKPRDCIDKIHHNTFAYQVANEAPTPAELKVQEFIWKNKMDHAIPATAISAPNLMEDDDTVRDDIVNHFETEITKLDVTDPAQLALKTDLENIQDRVRHSAGSKPYDVLMVEAGMSTDPNFDSRSRDVVLHSLLESESNANLRFTARGWEKNNASIGPKEVLRLFEKELERERDLESDTARKAQLSMDIKQLKDWQDNLNSKNNREKAAAEAQFHDFCEARFRNDPAETRRLLDTDHNKNEHAGRVTAFLILGRVITGAALRFIPL